MHGSRELPAVPGEASKEVDERDEDKGCEEEEEEDESEGVGRRRSWARRTWFKLRRQMSETELNGQVGGRPFDLLKAEDKPQEPGGAEAEDEDDDDGPETMCGVGPWRPAWLQRLRSKKAFVLAYGVTGMSYFAVSAYFNATITTLEKRFMIPSRTSGLINSAWDLGSLSSVLLMGYLGMHGHKPRLVSMGAMVVALSCFARLIPHLMFGPGEDALALTVEFGDAPPPDAGDNATGGWAEPLCGGGARAAAAAAAEECAAFDAGTATASERAAEAWKGMEAWLPTALLFACQLMQGVGCSVYWTLGLTYLDDNTTKNKAPLLHATSQCLRMLGPTLGFTLASYTLAKYVDPSLHPRIDNNDPRWIGAWWLGWVPLGCAVTLLGTTMMLFPRQLPRTARRRAERMRRNIVQAAVLPKNFFHAFGRLLKNRILVYNTLSAVCFVYGGVGYWIFMPKYMETIYKQSSSRASLISGSVGLASAGLGVIVSAVVMAKWRPRARLVAGWNVVVEGADAFVKFLWIFLHCGEDRLSGHYAEQGWNMTDACNARCDCGPEIKYSPVCSAQGDMSFFSPCHAGCSDSMDFLNGTKMFTNCSCVEGGVALDGPCPMDCVTNFTIFLLSQCVMNFLAASGKAGNIIIQFRCVHEDDKPLAMAFSEFLMCGLGFIPAPIIFGALLDSTCLVWRETCGDSGNCWLYDGVHFRYLLNLTGGGFTLMGMLLDMGVCYHAKGLQIYDDDEDGTEDGGGGGGGGGGGSGIRKSSVLEINGPARSLLTP